MSGLWFAVHSFHTEAILNIASVLYHIEYG
jgi:hypothetical protein